MAEEIENAKRELRAYQQERRLAMFHNDDGHVDYVRSPQRDDEEQGDKNRNADPLLINGRST